MHARVLTINFEMNNNKKVIQIHCSDSLSGQKQVPLIRCQHIAQNSLLGTNLKCEYCKFCKASPKPSDIIDFQRQRLNLKDIWASFYSPPWRCPGDLNCPLLIPHRNLSKLTPQYWQPFINGNMWEPNCLLMIICKSHLNQFFLLVIKC